MIHQAPGKMLSSLFLSTQLLAECWLIRFENLRPYQKDELVHRHSNLCRETAQSLSGLALVLNIQNLNFLESALN